MYAMYIVGKTHVTSQGGFRCLSGCGSPRMRLMAASLFLETAHEFARGSSSDSVLFFPLGGALQTLPLLFGLSQHLLLTLSQGDAKAGLAPYLRPLPDEDEGDDAHGGAEAAEEGAGARDAEAGEHGRGGEGQDDGEEGAAAGGGGVGGGGEDLVGVGEVVEQGHEDEHEAHAEGDAGEHGGDEGDGVLGAEAEPEEGDDVQWAADAGEGHAAVFLALDPAVAAVLGAREDAVPVPEDGHAEHGAAADGQVAQAGDAGGEAVEALEDDGEGLEGHVEDGIDEGEVGAGGGDNGLGEEHAQGPGEDDGEKAVQVRLLEVAGGDDAQRWVLLAEPACPLGEQDRAKRLGDEDDEDERGAGVHEGDPERPAPANGRGREAGHDGREERAPDGGLQAGNG